MTGNHLRAMLFVPADARKLAKLPELDADAVIIDLEDAIPRSEQQSARTLTTAALESQHTATLVVRVNADASTCALDLDAVVGANLDAIMIPKAESADQLEEVADRLQRLEAERGLDPMRVKIFALVESARGIAQIEAIAGAVPERLAGLAFGPADLALDLGLRVSEDGSELAYARSRMVIAARCAGLPSPIDGPFDRLSDLDGLVSDSRRSYGFGFQGRLVLHPRHVDVVRDAYGIPTEIELERARRIVAAFEAETVRGHGVCVVDDLVVDEPVYRRQLGLLSEATEDLPAVDGAAR